MTEGRGLRSREKWLLALSLILFSVATVYRAMQFTSFSGAIGLLALICALLLGSGFLYAYLSDDEQDR